MVAEAADPFPLSLSLSDCAEGVFASYQLMLAKESRLKLFSFRRWRRNYVLASLGAPYDDSSLQSLRTLVTRRRWYNTNGS